MADKQQPKRKRASDAQLREMVENLKNNSDFSTIHDKWKSLAKKKNVNVKERSHARFLLLQLYQPFQLDYQPFILAKSKAETDLRVLWELALKLASKWYVDPSNQTDLGTVVWRMPAAFPVVPHADDPDMIFFYAEEARKIIAHQSSIQISADEFSQHDAILQVGYTEFYLDLKRPINEIAETIGKYKKLLEHSPSQRSALLRSTHPIAHALDGIKRLEAYDPLLVALVSRGLTPVEVQRAIEVNYNSANSNRSRYTRRIASLLSFIDPLDYGKIRKQISRKK